MSNFLTLYRREVEEGERLVKRSERRLRSAFNEDFEYHHLAIHRSSTFLRRHAGKKTRMFVLFVDLGKSTIMSSDLAPEAFARIIRLFSQEMSYVIEYYGGFVLKFVGDAVIGYFPKEPAQGNPAVRVICCASTLNRVIKGSVNPVLHQEGLPPLQIKFSTDFGTNNIVRYGSDKTRSHVDIIGLSINLAAKMQTLGSPSDFVIGKTVYTKLPERLKICFKRIHTNTGMWPYHEIHSSSKYPVFLTRV